MSEMIERVAKAIHNQVGVPMRVAERLARAAIEAMREPTEEMSFAALGMDTAPEQAVAVWQAIIDAALADPTKTPSTE